MIITVTPSPSLDLTYVVDRPLHARGDVEVHRARSAVLEASGKGVNVSRALHGAGTPTIAVLPVAGATGDQLLGLLDGEGVPHRAVSRGGATRVNTTVLSAGETLKINAPNTPFTPADAARLVQAVALVLDEVRGHPSDDGTWLVICGSLPQGDTAGVVRTLVETARGRDVRVAADTSGAALAEALSVGVDLASPNVRELAEVDASVQAALAAATPGLVAQAAARYSARTGTELLISAGAQGATWTDGTRMVRAVPRPVTPVNTAGAGDALLAGWLSAPGTPGERLKRAVEWGTATCQSPTTVCPDVATAAARHPVTVTSVGADRTNPSAAQQRT